MHSLIHTLTLICLYIFVFGCLPLQWVRPLLAALPDWLGHIRARPARPAHLHQGHVRGFYSHSLLTMWVLMDILSLHTGTAVYCRYKNLPSYVTENGLAWQEDTVLEAVNDTMRQQYLHDHIDAVGQALQAGCDVKGYFIWSFQVTNCLLLPLLLLPTATTVPAI